MKAHKMFSKLFDTALNRIVNTCIYDNFTKYPQNTEKSSHSTEYLAETKKSIYHNYQISNCI